MNLRRLAALVLLALGMVLGIGHVASAAAGEGQPAVLRVPVTGVIDPLLADSVQHAIERANAEHDQLVLLVVDTPGGLDSSMRQIVKAILKSDVPVVGYVAPPGARAASAGTFVIAATSWAAMAPGTTIGAAHPVGVSGAVEIEKVTNDAAAYIRGLAEGRKRSPGAVRWYDDAVRDAIDAHADEALRLGVVDAIAPDQAALLNQLDGKSL